MRPLILTLTLALAAPAFADTAAKTPKSRTLKEVIDLAMREGKETTLNMEMAEKMGFGRVEMPEKKLRYKQSICPDKNEHSFRVVLQKTSSGSYSPLALDLGRTSGGMVDGKLVTDGMIFRATLSGKLERAFHNKGAAGELVSEELSIKSKDVKKQFQEELDFYRAQVPALGLEFSK